MLNARHPADLAFTAQEYEAAHELRRQPQAPLLIFAGSLRPQKRPDRFLRVVKLVHERFGIVEAWMLGDGPEREQVRRMAKELAIADHVHMLGYQEHVAPYLAQADLLLLTSDSEGTPGVVIEAAMLGKPSVATNTGGTTGCILDRETGILAPPEDEALAAAVLELLRDPDTRLRYGRRAKSWVGEHFTMDRVARRYLNFYEELTQGRRK
jgi:glycosyltransferase involved in cell wall biosynthesis